MYLGVRDIDKDIETFPPCKHFKLCPFVSVSNDRFGLCACADLLRSHQRASVPINELILRFERAVPGYRCELLSSAGIESNMNELLQ